MTDANEPAWKTNPRCDEDQLAMLRRCSEAEDMTEWNDWRKANPDEKVWLQWADLQGVHLEGADLQGAHLEGADLQGAHLEGASLEGAKLSGATLDEAQFKEGNLCGAILKNVSMRGTNFSFAVTDGETYIFPRDAGAGIDRETYASGVPFGNIRINPGVRLLLEYNVRRKRWLRWCGGRYGQGGKLQKTRWWPWVCGRPVWLFWQLSDYGKSTWRIIESFVLLSFAFAAAYFTWGVCAYPGIVDGLFKDDIGLIGSPSHVLQRALYFSVVTMTTLGFGDMYARARSLPGHWLLMAQVVLGYMLLGALICRLAILFQAGGPAAKFAKPPLWRRLIKWGVVVCVCLALAFACCRWYGWAESKWPEVIERAAAVDGAKSEQP